MDEPTKPAGQPAQSKPHEQIASPESPLAVMREHVVATGETTEQIAKKYGVNPYDIRYANQVWNRTLQVGEKIKIPPPRAPRNSSPKPGPTETNPAK